MQLWMELLTAAWFFYLGAAVGSFSNVVAWRMPRGIPFSASVSRCPNCGKAISFFDNVPIFGWLWLRGRCRHCRWPIPVRYFLVEVAYGAIFLFLYDLDLRIPHKSGEFPWPWIDEPRAIGRFLYQATLMSLLGICWLVRFQGDAVPQRLWWFGVVFGLGSVAVFPSLNSSGIPWNGWVPPSLLDSLSGLSAGAIYDVCMTWMAIPPRREKRPSGSLCELSLAGGFVGILPIFGVLAVIGLIATAHFRGWSRRFVEETGVTVKPYYVCLAWASVAFVLSAAWFFCLARWESEVASLSEVVGVGPRFGVIALAGLVSLIDWRRNRA